MSRHGRIAGRAPPSEPRKAIVESARRMGCPGEKPAVPLRQGEDQCGADEPPTSPKECGKELFVSLSLHADLKVLALSLIHI